MRLWPRSDAARTAILITTLLLSGCAEMRSVQDMMASALPDRKPATSATPPAEVRLRPSVTAPAPESLIGVDSTAVIAAMGTPDFKRQEPGAEIWRYSAPDCQLLIFLYAAGNGALTSSHLTARREGGGEVDVKACLQYVADARARGASS